MKTTYYLNPNKKVNTSTFSGTIKEVFESNNGATYLLYFDSDFVCLETKVVGLFGNNRNNEKILTVGNKFYNTELREILEK